MSEQVYENKAILAAIIDRIQLLEIKPLCTKNLSPIRHASVAAIIRWCPVEAIAQKHASLTVSDFLKEPWTESGELQLLFIQRAFQEGDPYLGQIAFPGGKSDPDDTDLLHTVVRECKEELGLNLNTNDFLLLGRLSPKTLTNEQGKPTNMSPQTPKMRLSRQEVAKAMWIPLTYLSKNPVILFNTINYGKGYTLCPGIDLKQTPDGPFLWGFTLRVAQEILGLPISTIVVSNNPEEKLEPTSKL